MALLGLLVPDLPHTPVSLLALLQVMPSPRGPLWTQVPLTFGRLPKSSQQAKPGAPETATRVPPLPPPHRLTTNTGQEALLLLFLSQQLRQELGCVFRSEQLRHGAEASCPRSDSSYGAEIPT